MTVKKSGFKNAGLGLFAARRFGKKEVISIYYAPKKSKEPIEDKCTIEYYSWYYTIPVRKSDVPPYYMGAHFINDATFECEDAEKRTYHAVIIANWRVCL